MFDFNCVLICLNLSVWDYDWHLTMTAVFPSINLSGQGPSFKLDQIMLGTGSGMSIDDFAQKKKYVQDRLSAIVDFWKVKPSKPIKPNKTIVLLRDPGQETRVEAPLQEGEGKSGKRAQDQHN